MKQHRDFALRSGLAHRLFRNELTLEQFKALKSASTDAQEEAKGTGSYHQKYSLQDQRAVRLALAKRSNKVRAAGTLPPLMVGRIARGGTGKTTVCGNVGALEAQMGYRTLLIDGDPQASLTVLAGADPSTDDIIHIGNMMDRTENGKKPNNDYVRSGIRPIYANGMLDIICADITLADFDARMSGGTAPERRFRTFLNAHIEVFGQYDVIIVDCAPGSTLLSYNFMFAANKVLAPVWLEGQSLKALELLLGNISELNEIDGGARTIELVANGFHSTYKHCRDSLLILQMAHGSDPKTGEPVFPGCVLNEIIIPDYVGFSRQVNVNEPEESQPLVEKEPNSDAVTALVNLTLSLNEKYDVRVSGNALEGVDLPDVPSVAVSAEHKAVVKAARKPKAVNQVKGARRG